MTRLANGAVVFLSSLLLAGGGSSAAAQDFDLSGSQPLTSSEAVPIKIQHLFVPPQGTVPYGRPCVECHDTGADEPFLPWQGSMMSQAARDPLFYAQLDLAIADGDIRPSVDGMSDMCLRCHSPVGWLEGRSADETGMSFIEKDMFGVQCHFCHRLVDPEIVAPDDDWTNILDDFSTEGLLPPTFGNGMFVVDPKQTRRGPWGTGELNYIEHLNQEIGVTANWSAIGMGLDEHPVFDSEFHRSSNLCGTCHDVSNPKDCSAGAGDTDVQDCFPIERTWTEWSGSKFASEGELGNCQSCHMSGPHNGIGFGAACEQGTNSGHLNDVHFHDLTGGNVWMPQAIVAMKQRYDACIAAGAGCVGAELSFRQAVDGLYPPAGGSPYVGVNETALSEGSERARRTLRRSASLEIEATSPTLDLKLTNLTGHKLPTGYPEGRRMWMNVQFYNGTGGLTGESGEYDAANGTLFHDEDVDPATAAKSYDVTAYTDGTGTGTLVAGSARPTKVWEARAHWDKSDCTAPDPADCPSEFHFVLNNEALMDNRIPPEGWDPVYYADNRAMPVIPAAYTANGWQGDYMEAGSAVNWDKFSYPLPAGTDYVRMTLYYQTASREYIEALVADNPNTLTAGGFNRGTLLEEVWEDTGRSQPNELLTKVQAIVDADANGLADGWESHHGLGGAGCVDDSYNGDPDADGLANWQEFQLDAVPGQDADPCDSGSPASAADRVPVDIILVLDFSGSMDDPAPVSGTPKIQVLREAVELFLETWKDHAHTDDRIGVVYFGTDATTFGGTLLHDFLDNWEAIRDEVNLRPAGGWTALGAGLQTGMAPLKNPVTQELIFDPANPRNAHMVVFSNGMQNHSPMLVPDIDFPDFLVVRDQTSAENPDVTGNSNVTIGAGLFAGFPLAPYTLHVHTVGIGVVENSGGDGWHTLLETLAVQQYGKHNFITDSKQLEGVFLEDLVTSLKGNTLEYLLEEEVTLAGKEVVELPIPINPTSKKFSIVISWRGQKSPPPAMQLVRPDGVVEPLARITRGGDTYQVITRFTDPRVGDPGEVGTWTLRLTHPRRRGDNVGLTQSVAAVSDDVAVSDLPPLTLQVHALLDDRELAYDFFVPRLARIGDDLVVTARATEDDQPLKWMDEVTVTVRRPGRSLGELLARSSHQLADSTSVAPDASVLPLQQKQLAAYLDPAFAAQLQPSFETLTLGDAGVDGDTSAGDGRFARRLPTPQVAGHYELHFRMKGHTLSGHPFVREEVRSLVVKIGPISPDRSGLVLRTEGGRPTLHLTPQDADGNLLGPGYGGQIIVRTADGRELGVIDDLDGSYRVPYPDGVDADVSVVVSLGGDGFHDGPVEGGGLADRGCVWILVLLALVIILWLVFKRWA